MSDRVELTEDEREALLFGFGIRFYENADHTRFAQGVAAVESIVAARVQALTAERDLFAHNCGQWMDSYKSQTEFAREVIAERDAARAELAAANTRCAEHVRIDTAEKYRAKAETLQATLDAAMVQLSRADHVLSESAIGWQLPRDVVHTMSTVLADLRAALTPEGKPQ